MTTSSGLPTESIDFNRAEHACWKQARKDGLVSSTYGEIALFRDCDLKAWSMKFLGLSGLLLLMVSCPVMMCSASGSNVTPKEVAAKPGDFNQVQADFKSLQVALMMYKLNAGDYPTGEQGLKSLVEKPKADPVPRRWVQVMAKIPKDPWGGDYRYVTRKRGEEIVHVIISSGPDALSPDDDVELVLEGDKK